NTEPVVRVIAETPTEERTKELCDAAGQILTGGPTSSSPTRRKGGTAAPSQKAPRKRRDSTSYVGLFNPTSARKGRPTVPTPGFRSLFLVPLLPIRYPARRIGCTEGHHDRQRSRSRRGVAPARGARLRADRGRRVGRKRRADVPRVGWSLGRPPHRGCRQPRRLRARPAARVAGLQRPARQRQDREAEPPPLRARRAP